MSVRHNDDSNVSTLEKKIPKIYHVLEELNYGILRIYAEFWKKIHKKYNPGLSEQLGASKDTIHCHIKILGKSYNSSTSVLHELIPKQTQRRMDICRCLICNTMDDRFIRRIVTCDGKWIHYRNPGASKQWLGPCHPVKIIVKKNLFGPKVMYVWWNFEGVIHWEFVPNGRAADADLYS